MSDHPLHQLAPATRVLRRAQTEPLSFSLLDGDVLVRNERYSDPGNHEYRVRVVDGLPTTCTCPASSKYAGPCKHQVAVAIRRRVLDAAVEMQAIADGGRAAGWAEEEGDSEAEEVFPGCEHLTPDFPCWDCVEAGRRDMPRND